MQEEVDSVALMVGNLSAEEVVLVRAVFAFDEILNLFVQEVDSVVLMVGNLSAEEVVLGRAV